MKKNTMLSRTLPALVLALAMVMAGVLPVMAETVERPVYVDNGDTNLDPDTDPVTGDAEEGWTLDADVKVESVEGAAVDVASYSNQWSEAQPSELTVNGDVETDAAIYTVYVAADGEDAEAKLTVNGNVTAGERTWGAIYVEGSDGGTATLQVSGDVAIANDGYYSLGIIVEAYDGGTADVTVDGRTTAASEGEDGYASVATLSANGEDSTASLTLGEGAEGTVSVAAFNQATAELTIESDGVTLENVQDGGEALRIQNGGIILVDEEISTDEGGMISAEITGDIVVTGSEEADYVNGLGSYTIGGTTSIEIKQGNISAESEGAPATGLRVLTGTLFTGEVSEDDEIDFSDQDEQPRLTNDYVSLEIDEGHTYTGELYVLGEGDAREYYIMWDGGCYLPVSNLKEDIKGETTLTMTGDVTSSHYGVMVGGSDAQQTDILIDGTVKGGEAGLVLMDDTQLGSGVTLTVWAVEPRDGAVVFDGDYTEVENPGEDGELLLTENKEAEAQLQYIIRVKADQKDIIAAAGDAFDYMGYKVAHENDTVTLKLNIPEGYEVVEAYSDQAQSMKLEKNEKGEYFLTVPRGGAVELSVKLNKLPDPEPEPEPEADTVMITYILGNGTENDHIRTTAAIGERVALQPAPERDGYTFLYWQCTDVDPNSSYYKQPDPQNDFQFRPGAIYTAKKDINFVAVWQKN